MVNFRDVKRVETKDASIVVDAGLPAGRYVFQLTVIDEVGNQSKLARINVEIVRRLVITDPRLVTPVIPSPIGPVTPIGPLRRID